MSRRPSIYSSLPVFLAFLCMGFGDVVGPLTGLVKQDYHLTNLAAQLIPFMGFLMFGLLSIPLGIAQHRLGRKNILMAGLIIGLLGLSIPYVSDFSTFGTLLPGILLLGAGSTFLQVSGNPIMRDVSPEGKFPRNLSLAQFIKAIGSLSGALIPLAAANYWGTDWKILFPIYSIFLLLAVIWLYFTRISQREVENPVRVSFKTSFALLAHRDVLLMVLGIFLYVGAEVSVSSGLPIFLQDSYGFDIAKMGLLGTLFFFIALMSGRFLGALILNWISPRLFLRITVIVSVLGFAGLVTGNQTLAMVSIFMIGLGFANIFPLIFSITVEKMPERINELSGLMVTAIVGGAIVPLIMGVMADASSTRMALLVPFICTLYIMLLAFSRKTALPSVK